MKILLPMLLTAASLFTATAALADDTCGYGESKDSWGAVNFAVCRSDLATLKQLVEVNHVDLNARDSRGRNALDAAFNHSTVYWMSGLDPAVISYLVAHGADTNANEYLDQAASFGEVEVAQILLKGGANVNGIGKYDTTPLEAAAGCDFRLSSDKNSVALVKLLLSYGANVHAKNDAALKSVPTPCGGSPQLCSADALRSATEWPTGSCKETYKTLLDATNASR